MPHPAVSGWTRVLSRSSAAGAGIVAAAAGMGAGELVAVEGAKVADAMHLTAEVDVETARLPVLTGS